MADASDLKSEDSNVVRVRVPPAVSDTIMSIPAQAANNLRFEFHENAIKEIVACLALLVIGLRTSKKIEGMVNLIFTTTEAAMLANRVDNLTSMFPLQCEENKNGADPNV